MKSRKENRDSNILLVDCSNLTYGAKFTTGTLSYEGKPTGIIFGFLIKTLFLAKKFKTNKFIFCWDGPNTYRYEDYKGYKEKRIERKKEATEFEKEEYNLIKNQTIELMENVIPNLGFKNNYFQERYEADDLLSYWVQRLSKTNNENLIMISSDNDMYQCLDFCKIYSPSTKKITTRKSFNKKYGIEPCDWPFAKAIGGCDGDSVKGIKGVGDPKSGTSFALKYIRNELTKGKIFDRICSGKGKRIIKRNLPIVTCPYRPDDLGTMIRRRDKFSRRKFIRVFDSFHFKSFLKKEAFANWKKAFLR